MFNNILIVCVGNICRSPMAEILFRKALTHSKKPKCQVSSAGIEAMVGHQADPKAIHLMHNRGLDLSHHRASQINRIMIRKSDLILVMESSHKQAIEANEPSAKGKIFRLGEWGKYDIQDPYKLELEVFETVLEQIDQGIDAWIKKL